MLKFKTKYIPIPTDRHIGEAKVKWAKRLQAAFNALVREGWDFTYHTDEAGALIIARKNVMSVEDAITAHLLTSGMNPGGSSNVSAAVLSNLLNLNPTPPGDKEVLRSNLTNEDKSFLDSLMNRIEAGAGALPINKQVQRLVPSLMKGVPAGDMAERFVRIEKFLEAHKSLSHTDGSTCELVEVLTALLKHGRECVRLSVS